MPVQNNLDYGIGPHNGSKYTFDIQPGIPIHLNQNLNLVTRYINPIVDQRDITGEKTSQFRRIVGMVMILFGLLSLLLAQVQHQIAVRKLKQYFPATQRSVFSVLSVLVLLFGLALFLGALLKQ